MLTPAQDTRLGALPHKRIGESDLPPTNGPVLDGQINRRKHMRTQPQASMVKHRYSILTHTEVPIGDTPPQTWILCTNQGAQASSLASETTEGREQ